MKGWKKKYKRGPKRGGSWGRTFSSDHHKSTIFILPQGGSPHRGGVALGEGGKSCLEGRNH